MYRDVEPLSKACSERVLLTTRCSALVFRPWRTSFAGCNHHQMPQGIKIPVLPQSDSAMAGVTWKYKQLRATVEGTAQNLFHTLARMPFFEPPTSNRIVWTQLKREFT
jgi:hypothetical protein